MNQTDLRTIDAAVCATFNALDRRKFPLHPRDLRGAARYRDVAYPRMVAMAVARRLTTYSLPQLGRYYGGRDHTTILHGLRTVATLPLLQRAADALVKTLPAQGTWRARFRDEMAAAAVVGAFVRTLSDYFRLPLLCTCEAWSADEYCARLGAVSCGLSSD